MPQPIWTPLAEFELEEILYYVRANDGRPLTSHRLGQEFLDIAVQFAEHPSRGHIHPAAPAGWLYFKHKR